MDHASEQALELEALEAIFADDLQPYSGMLPDGWAAVGQTYKITIDPREEGEEVSPDEERIMELLFAHTASYPEEAPCVRLKAVRGLSNADIGEGMAMLQQQVEENLGMAMIYQLITAAKEWLQSRVGSSGAEDPELSEKKMREEEERKRAELRAHGVPVSVERFNVWKAKFEAERAAEKAKAAAEQAASEPGRAVRLSGKAWFLKEGPGAEGNTEAGALSDDDEGNFDDEDYQPGAGDDEDDIDFEDDDDEGMLDEL